MAGTFAVGPIEAASGGGGGGPSVPFTFTAPLERQVVQRHPSTQLGTIPIAGVTAAGLSAIARATPVDGFSGTQTAWQFVSVTTGEVDGSIEALPGWYTVEIKVYGSSGQYLSNATSDVVGVGDVFITAGQSNAANYAEPLNVSVPVSPIVVCRGIAPGDTWRVAVDPQPTAGGTHSSPWPLLGDLIVDETSFPVAFVSVAVPNTAIADWTPGSANFDKIIAALGLFEGPNGFKALLWDQGENDAAISTTQLAYATALISIVTEVRDLAGWEVPCGIATATHPNEATGAGVIAAQEEVSEYAGCFPGADTDSLDNTFRYDNVHFNTTTGTPAVAELWYDAIESNLGL